jgi:hypothetical protein
MHRSTRGDLDLIGNVERSMEVLSGKCKVYVECLLTPLGSLSESLIALSEWAVSCGRGRKRPPGRVVRLGGDL